MVDLRADVRALPAHPRLALKNSPGGVRVVASANGGEPVVWFVPGQG